VYIIKRLAPQRGRRERPVIINEAVFQKVVERALERVQGNKQWTNAIRRGAELIQSNRCLQMADDGTLLILSDSGHNYAVNGVCRTEQGLCPAFANHKPCKHRAAYRLLQLYNEGEY
jgi:hypothetical protein